MKNLKVLMGALSALVLMSSCAKDKNLDDFKAQQFHTDMVQLQQANGYYTGLLISKKDGTNLGAIGVNYEAKTAVLNSGDQTKASAQPIMTSSVDFVGATRMQIVATNAYYEPNSGQIQTEIAVLRGTVTNTIVLNGTLNKDSGSIVGTIEDKGYPTQGATFVLVKNGQGLDDIIAQNKVSAKPVAVLQGVTYVGETDFQDKLHTVKPVKMILLKTETTSQDDFLTLLSPVNPVTMTMNYGQSALITFTGANWDTQSTQSKLIGTTTLNTNAVSPGGQIVIQQSDMTINCDYDSRKDTFLCRHIVAGSTFAAITRVHKATTSVPTDPNDSSATRDAISYDYVGQGFFHDGTRPIGMTFTYDARTRLQDVTDLFLPTSEKIVRIALVIMGIDNVTKKPYVISPLPSFTATKWDEINLALDANQSSTTGSSGTPFTLTLACTHFKADDPKYNFTCSYSSSLLSGGNVTLKLHAN